MPNAWNSSEELRNSGACIQGHDSSGQLLPSGPCILVFLQNTPWGHESASKPVSEQWTSSALWSKLESSFAAMHSVAFDETNVNPAQPVFQAIAADVIRLTGQI